MCTYRQAQLKKAKRHGPIREDIWNKLVGDFEPFGLWEENPDFRLWRV